MTVLGGGDAKLGNEIGLSKLGDKLTGSVAKTVKIDAGESKEVTFVLSWYFPNRRTHVGRATGDWNAAILQKVVKELVKCTTTGSIVL